MLNLSRQYASKIENICKTILEKKSKSFYVEDFNSSVSNLAEGKGLCRKMKLRFLQATFDVSNWKVDDKVSRNYFETMEKEISSNSETPNIGKVKIVGVEWKTEPNRLVFSFEV